MSITINELPLPDKDIPFEKQLEDVHTALTNRNEDFWRRHYMLEGLSYLMKAERLHKKYKATKGERELWIPTLSLAAITAFLVSINAFGTNFIMQGSIYDPSAFDIALALLQMVLVNTSILCVLIAAALTPSHFKQRRLYDSILRKQRDEGVIVKEEYVSTYSIKVRSTDDGSYAAITNTTGPKSVLRRMTKHSLDAEVHSVRLDDDIAIAAEQVIQVSALVAKLQETNVKAQERGKIQGQNHHARGWQELQDERAALLAKPSLYGNIMEHLDPSRRERKIKARGHKNIAKSLDALAQESLKTHHTDKMLEHDVHAMLQEHQTQEAITYTQSQEG